MNNALSEISFLYYLENKHQGDVSNALTYEAHLSTDMYGMKGEPLPYQLRSDWMVTGVLFLCFIMVSYVLSHGKTHLIEKFKNFFSTKERVNLFDTASDMSHTLFLIFQTCLLLGFCTFDYFFDHYNAIFTYVSHQIVLVTFIAIYMVYFALKWLSYTFVNIILFNKTKAKLWNEAYFNVVIWAGLLLVIPVLLIVFFNLSPRLTFIFVSIIVIISKFLLVYKCFTNFFNRIRYSFHFILYFCALEIFPDLIFWKGIMLWDNYWF
ncbi:MAG: DUF4271 domain-containing protein [Phocaeicola sp.]|uniref:DUF4271 domain-containing protein n=1 Tax=Phocaeicola sp. TaxID=2773926 RepID=UPI003F9F319F